MIDNKTHRLTPSKKPILLFKEVPELKTQFDRKCEYYFCSTIDKHVYLVQCNPEQQKFMHQPCQLSIKNILPTQLYIDKNNLCLYVGYLNGDVQWFRILNLNKSGKIKNSLKNIQSKVCREVKPDSNKKVIQLYTVGIDLFVWDVSCRIRRIKVTTAEVLQKFQFNQQITAITYFNNPETYHTAVCISFLDYNTPQIFDGTQIQQLKNSYQMSIIITNENQSMMQQSYSLQKSNNATLLSSNLTQKKQEIIQIRVINMLESTKIFAVCGLINKVNNSYSLKIFEVLYEQKYEIYICQLHQRIQLKSSLTNISFKDNIMMIIMWDRLQLIRFTENTINKLITIKKKGINWAFIISISDKRIKFLYDKGFNYLKPNQSEKDGPALKIRNRIIDIN